MINDSYIVTFHNTEHKAYVDLMFEYGFDLTIGANMRVGLVFTHPSKGLIVILEVEEDYDRATEYEPHLFIKVRDTPTQQGTTDLRDYDTPMQETHYTDTEWKWLQGDDPSFIEFLRRELHIWIKVRPHTMNQQKRV